MKTSSRSYLNGLGSLRGAIIFSLLILVTGCATTPLSSSSKEEGVNTPLSTSAFLTWLPTKSASLNFAKNIEAAQNMINKIILSPCFKTQFANLPKLNETYKTPLEVHSHIVSSKVEAVAKPWKPLNPFTSAVASTTGNIISLNVRKIGSWSTLDYAETGMHESMHVLGYHHEFWNYKGRELTAPYFAGFALFKCGKELGY